MPFITRLGTLGTLAIAAFAVTAATAGAELPEFLPGSGSLTEKSGASKFSGPFTISCAKDSGKGTITGGRTIEVDLDYEGCEAAGVKLHSAGDAAGVILRKGKGTLCYVNATTKEVGSYLEYSETNFEGVGLKGTIKGSEVGIVAPTNISQLTGKVTLAKPNVKECGGKKAELLANLNGGAFKAAEEQSTEEITFSAKTEVMA